MLTKNLMDKLVAECGCVLHSTVGPFPPDVDVYAPMAQFEKAKAMVSLEGYVPTQQKAYQAIYRRFEGGQMFIIDMIVDYNMWIEYTLLRASLRLSTAGNDRLGRSHTTYKCFKYFCDCQSNKLRQIETHLDKLSAFLKDERNFIFISQHLRQAAAGQLADVLRTVDTPNIHTLFLPRLLMYNVIGWLRLRWDNLGKGCSIAFVGPDGSGKSFFIKKLKPIGFTRTVYMGDSCFACQNFYNLILKIPSPYNRFIYGFYIIENYLRLLRVAILRFLGANVLIDRFPGTNRNIVHGGALGRINRFIFRIFPKPDMLVLLDAPPEIVHQRKQELSVQEIGRIQNQLRTLLKGTRHMVLDTEQLDISLNALLAVVYARLNRSNEHVS